MIHYLLDTNICIELIRGRSEATLRQMKRQAAGSVGISTITLAELRFGVSRSADPTRNLLALVHFIAPLDVLSFDDDAAAAYGGVRADLEGAGTPIGPLDTLIAAHALALDVTLVTNNEREFRRVAGLRVVNWTRE